ncbi:MAG: hypothetical protein KGI27_15140, partial [Thaumarchaeota archaeon]|nr:hypothetical protein [Nitrososphaerota archaeon]
MKIVIIILSLAAIPAVYHITTNIQSGIYHARQRFAYHDFTTEHLFPNLPEIVFSTSDRLLDKTKKPTKIGSSVEYNLNMKYLNSIMKAIAESSLIGKTALSEKVNMNYLRMRPYLEWMYNKSLLESIIEDNKIKFRLT